MRRQGRRSERGAAAVEMAIATPLLLVLVMGIIDLGRVLHTGVVLREAAQEGAMYGSYAPGSYPAVEGRVIASLDSPTLTESHVKVSCPDGPDGSRIRVRVRYDVGLLTPIVKQWFGNTYRINSEVTGRIYVDDQCDPSPDP